MSLVEFLQILARPHCREAIRLARDIAVDRAQAKAADARTDALQILHAIADNIDHDIVERRRAATSIITASRPTFRRADRKPSPVPPGDAPNPHQDLDAEATHFANRAEAIRTSPVREHGAQEREPRRSHQNTPDTLRQSLTNLRLEEAQAMCHG